MPASIYATNGQSTAQSALDYIIRLQQQLGSTDYSAWTAVPGQWYSFVKYPKAGAAVFNFFGDAIGSNSVTTQLTNLPKQGSLGQVHFLLNSFQFSYFIGDYKLNNAWTVDADLLASDLLFGFATAGAFTFTIGQRIYAQFPKPFLYAPPADGRAQSISGGLQTLTLVAGTPNTLGGLTTPNPNVELATRNEGCYRLDPTVLIEAEQNFAGKISFESGALPLIAQNVVDDTTNALYIGCIMDGVTYRPMS